MHALSKISIAAAAFAGLAVSGCSEKKEQPAPPAPAETPPPNVYVPPTAAEVRNAFETVAKSNAAPLRESPAGNALYTVTGAIALREDPDVHANTLKTVAAGSCLKLLERVGDDGDADSYTYAKVEVMGQDAKGWVAKRALRPAPECKTP